MAETEHESKIKLVDAAVSVVRAKGYAAARVDDICAAAGLTKGKRITCYEHVRFEAEQAGGTFVDQQAIRDGRIITGQTWQSHPEFYREIFAK